MEPLGPFASVTKKPASKDSSGLNGRIGLRLGVDTAGYLENGSLPELGTQFNLRRAFIYTAGEFHLLLPILFKIDVGGIGESPYLSDIYLWLQGCALRRDGQARPVGARDVARDSDRQLQSDVHGICLARREHCLRV